MAHDLQHEVLQLAQRRAKEQERRRASVDGAGSDVMPHLQNLESMQMMRSGAL